jgi:hypothetical protein
MRRFDLRRNNLQVGQKRREAQRHMCSDSLLVGAGESSEHSIRAFLGGAHCALVVKPRASGMGPALWIYHGRVSRADGQRRRDRAFASPLLLNCLGADKGISQRPVIEAG